MTFALIGYPLSSAYRRRFETLAGCTPHYLSISEMRRLPPMQLARTLWSLRGHKVFIPLEDENSLALLPMLQGLAAVSPAGEIEMVTPDLSREPVRRWKVGLVGFAVLKASARSWMSARRCRYEVNRLLKSSRIDAQPTGLRLLYLKTNLWFGVKAGGSVGHIAGVVNGFVEKGYAVRFAAAEPPVMLDAKVDFLPISPPTVFGLPSELNYYRFHRMFTDQALNYVRSDRISFIYQRMSVANYSGVLLSRQLRCPLVLEYNGSEAWIAKNWGRQLRYHDLAVASEAVCLKHAHIVVTVSNILRDELLERGVEAKRVVVYPNCVDTRVFDPTVYTSADAIALREQYGIAADALVVTFVGTFGQWHGAEVLANAIRRMVDKDSAWLDAHRVHFLLVGDGLRMPDVRERLHGERYRPYVTLTGLVPQHEAPRHLAASDILVSPHVPNTDGSRFFGSPTKLFEYMAMGKGILASDLEQIGQVLRPALFVHEPPRGAPDANAEELALMTTPGSADEIIGGIRFLVENPAWLERLGDNARKQALARYTWNQHVDAILSGLDKVMTTPSGG